MTDNNKQIRKLGSETALLILSMEKKIRNDYAGISYKILENKGILKKIALSKL